MRGSGPAIWKLGLGLLVAVCLSTALAMPVAAQTDNRRTGGPRADAPMQFGPFYITPVLELSEFGVDTNVFNSRGEQQSDFTFTGGPMIDIALPLRRFVFTTETVTDFVYYHEFENQRGLNFETTLRAEVQLPKLSLFVADMFIHTRQRPNFEIDVRARRRHNEARAGVTIAVSRKLELEIAAQQSIREFEADDVIGESLARRLNRDAIGASGSFRYAPTPLTTITITGETLEESFPLSPARNNRSWSFVPGVEFHPRALISGGAEVGFRRMRGQKETLPDFDGLVATVDLSYELLGSTTLEFTADRNVEFSLELTEPYYVATGYGVSFSHQLTAAFGLSVGTERITYDYQQFGSGGGGDLPVGRVNTTGYSATLSRQLTRTTEIGFDVSYHSRRSPSRPFRDYDGLVAGMTMGYAF